MVTDAPAFRFVEREAAIYRRLWRATVFSQFVGPALYLLAMGVGLGGMISAAGRTVDGLSYLVFVAPGPDGRHRPAERHRRVALAGAVGVQVAALLRRHGRLAHVAGRRLHRQHLLDRPALRRERAGLPDRGRAPRCHPLGLGGAGRAGRRAGCHRPGRAPGGLGGHPGGRPRVRHHHALPDAAHVPVLGHVLPPEPAAGAAAAHRLGAAVVAQRGAVPRGHHRPRWAPPAGGACSATWPCSAPMWVWAGGSGCGPSPGDWRHEPGRPGRPGHPGWAAAHAPVVDPPAARAPPCPRPCACSSATWWPGGACG